MAFPKQGGLGASPVLMLVIAAVVIVIVIIALYFLLIGSGVTYVSSSTNVTLAPMNSIYFSLPDSKSVYVLFLKSSAPSSATVYMSTLPLLAGQISVLQMTRGQTFNISTGGSSIADLQVKLIGANQTQSLIELSFIPKLLNVKPSSGIGYLSSSPTGNVTNQSSSGVTTTVTTTGTTTAGSSTSTTTVPKNLAQEALTEANESSYGILINEYGALFAKDTACTAPIFNTTFSAEVHQPHTGPNSFENVSPFIPTAITGGASVYSGDLYNVTYSSSTPAFGVAPILLMQMNVTANTVKSTKFTGVFAGQNYTGISDDYAFQSGISNNCGAYIS